MTSTTTTEYEYTEELSPFIPDGSRSVLKASTWAHGECLHVSIEAGSIQTGETPEELFAGQLISTPSHVDLPPEAALKLAAYLVAAALPAERGERADALVKFTESIL